MIKFKKQHRFNAGGYYWRAALISTRPPRRFGYAWLGTAVELAYYEVNWLAKATAMARGIDENNADNWRYLYR